MDTILRTYFLTHVTVLILSLGNANADYNCSLPEQSVIQDFIQRSFEKDKHIIRVNLTIIGNISTFEINNTAGVLNRHEWIFTKDDNGRSLLLLNENFEWMSLFTLSASVGRKSARVRQDPENCLYNLTEPEIETIIRLYFLNLIDNTKESTENVQICNKHIVEEESNVAEILYECCSKLSDDQLNCVKVQPGKWFKTFTVCKYILMLVAWGFFADLIPTSLLVKRKHVVLVRSLSENKCFNIDIHNLSTPHQHHAGFFKWIWSTCVLLDFKDTNADTKLCCTQDIFYTNCSEHCTCVWYKCLRKLAYVIIFIIVSSPLLFRFFLYFKIETKAQSYLYDQLNKRNLTTNYKWYSIMQHDIFLRMFISFQLAIYFILVFFLLFQRPIKFLRNFGIFENDNKMKLSDILSRSFNITFMRCKYFGKWFGFVHLLFLPITFLIALIYVFVTVLPVCQLICKIFCMICSKAKIPCHRFLSIGLMFFLETVIISIFSFGEGIAFFVQCAVYFMAGAILNYDTNLKYIGVVIFICHYGHEVIHKANVKFETFRKLIFKCLCGCLEDNLKNVKQKNECDFYFTALQNEYSIENSNRKRKLTINHGGLVFYTKYHGKWNVLVSNNLLNHLASLGVHPSCPGSLSMIYLRAMGVILSRALLLGFVLFTILALSYDFSASMKTVFALLSGFIVTNIRNFSPSSNESWDDGSEYWQNELKRKGSDILKSYTENWTVGQYDSEIV